MTSNLPGQAEAAAEDVECLLIVDAGPALTIFASHEENILIQAAEQRHATLAIPEIVEIEIRGKALDARFARTPVVSTLNTLKSSGRLVVLDGSLTDDMGHVIARVSGIPAAQRLRSKKDRGELMVITHASLHATSGRIAIAMIDDRGGRQLARKEIVHLAASQAEPFELTTTVALVVQADAAGWLSGDAATIYTKMRSFDDGLPPWEQVQRLRSQEA